MPKPRIDAHAHMAFHPSVQPMMEFVEEMNLRIINTSGRITPGWHDQGRVVCYRELAAARPDLFAWITGFDIPEFDNPNYGARIVKQLEEDFRQGAVGCKLWRQIGMTIRKPDGEFMLMDDPILHPLYETLIKHNKTLLVHISEPFNRWPGYHGKRIGFYGRQFDRSPLENEYGIVDFPDPYAQIDAQNRLMETYPELRVVGAHFGGLEHDWRELKRQLDEFPNFAVDTSARRVDLAMQSLKDTEAVKQFFSDYRDRILWGMDQGTGTAIITDKTESRSVDNWITINRDGYEFEENLYEKTGEVTVDLYSDIPGLGLSDDILQRLYIDNTLTWYPDAFKN